MARHLRLTRELVDRLPRRTHDRGPLAGGAVPEEYFGQVGAEILARVAGGPLWVFAFGSILWKRRFAVVEKQAATVRGWHRNFCPGPDRRYRGSPAAPGVMLSLDRGRQCRGMVLRMDEAGRAAFAGESG